MKCLVKRPVVASVTVLVTASLAVGGCGGAGNSPPAGCLSEPVQSAASGAAADWTLPGGNLANTRDVASPITSSNVAQLGVAWCVPAKFSLEPGVFGGIESQLASNGTTTFAAVNNLAVPLTVKGVAESYKAFEASIPKATGQMIAVSQDTGKIEWDDQLPSSPHGAATITNNVVFTTTYNGHLYAFNAATGAILLNTPLSAGTNAPVTIAGDYVIAGAAVPLSGQSLIIAYKLGATGKLPHTVG